jgi:hypothetical protein
LIAEAVDRSIAFNGRQKISVICARKTWAAALRRHEQKPDIIINGHILSG